MQRPGPMGDPNAVPGAMAHQVDGRGPGGGKLRPGGWQPFDVAPVKGQVEVTVDASGQVFLRGVVTSEEAGREIAEAARSVPGVSRVETQFQVLPRHAGRRKPATAPGDPVEPRRAPAGDAASAARAGGAGRCPEGPTGQSTGPRANRLRRAPRRSTRET